MWCGPDASGRQKLRNGSSVSAWVFNSVLDCVSG
jgi:hypothetical protein